MFCINFLELQSFREKRSNYLMILQIESGAQRRPSSSRAGAADEDERLRVGADSAEGEAGLGGTGAHALPHLRRLRRLLVCT